MPGFQDIRTLSLTEQSLMKKTLKGLAIVLLPIVLIGCASTPEKAPDINLSEQAFEAITAGDYEKAEALLEVALSINPDNPYALLNLGVVYQQTGRIDQAREQYVKVILLDSQEKVFTSNVKGLEGEKLVDIAKRNLENL
jgi:Tfp pilus assembly protein PilF